MRKNKAIFDNNTKSEALQAYFDEIKDIPLLTLEEEKNLFKRLKDGEKGAKERLIKANSRLVIKIAKVYNSIDPSLKEDIIQEGNLGLIHAVDKYDCQKNTRFSTYASFWIRQYISRFLANKRRDIHLPHRKEECLRNVHKVEQSLTQKLMRQPTTEEIAAEMRIPAKEIGLILNMTSGHISLEAFRTEEDVSSMIDVCEDYTYNPEHTFFRKFSQDTMMRLLNHLNPREKWILIHRYNLNGNKKRYTLRSLGDKMQISPETVRQIENKALQKMRVYALELRENFYAG